MTSDGRNLPVYLTTAEVAAMIRIKPRTLEDWRLDGKGPPATKLGKGNVARVVYRLEAVLQWLKDHEREP
ncbi:helix-turn-helix domain-containing protein [Hyphomicrobium sp. B1]|uniref:helix-turn-helix transcriptional regulator n=1 Tax=unclassified Hyphomicrobium TaxID=2619925 RepID=UPI00391ACE81